MLPKVQAWLRGRTAVARRAAPAGLACAVGLLGLAVALAWLAPLPDRLAIEGSFSIQDGEGETLHVFLAPDGRWRIPVAVDEVDPAYVEALIRFEDKRFDSHMGVDLLAVLRAVWLNATQGRVVSGGSTITMQLVRLVEPRPRTIGSKVVEALRAVQIELRMSKREILESYLAFASFGRNIEGVEAGALSCFGHRSDHLSAAEIATLLAIPQNPAPRYPSAANAPRLKEARDRIAAVLVDEGLFLPDGDSRVSVASRTAEVVAEPVPDRLRPMPRAAPHLAYWLRSRTPPGQAVLRTTIDAGLQRRVEERLAASREGLERRGIQHGAAVVLDHRSMEVVALVGNLSYWDDTPGRQIPAFDVRRSPGSTLKPFIYAQGIDEGHVLPGFLVPDVPVQYGDYSPKNYDGSFDGLVPLEDALSRSLNVPFVHLLGALGTDRFLGSLQRMGVTGLETAPGWYGLSVAVGGVELTPLEVAGLYATLARGGHFEPITLVPAAGPRRAAGDPVISEGASYLARRALARRDRPGFLQRKDLASVREKIHWKTGTSSGRRDAWAVGSGSRYTVAVWLGNLDNSSSAHLVGSDAAGPLFFDLVEAMHRGASPLGDHAPADLGEIEVCSYSGHPPGEACEGRRRVLAKAAHVPASTCPYHRKVELDVTTGLAVGPGCREGRETTEESVLIWPASIRRWLERSRGGLPAPPSWAEGCEAPDDGRPPRIVHPPSGHVALLVPGMDPSAQQVPLVAEAPDGEQLEWFVDGQFIGRAGAAERLWWTPKPGHHQILVNDPRGRRARRSLEVRLRR